MNEKAFVSIREASSITGLEAQTLRKLADQQILPCYKTPAGQRMFDSTWSGNDVSFWLY
jgi:DNA-binding transcriptional MerR regulator